MNDCLTALRRSWDLEDHRPGVGQTLIRLRARWAPPGELLGPCPEHEQGERSGNDDGGQVDHQLNRRADCLPRHPIGDRHGSVGGCRDRRHRDQNAHQRTGLGGGKREHACDAGEETNNPGERIGFQMKLVKWPLGNQHGFVEKS